jgi:hypothetical protein
LCENLLDITPFDDIGSIDDITPFDGIVYLEVWTLQNAGGEFDGIFCEDDKSRICKCGIMLSNSRDLFYYTVV